VRPKVFSARESQDVRALGPAEAGLRASSDLNVMRRPADGRLFLLSNQLPEKLVMRYQLWSWAHLVIFLGAGGLSFALFV